MPREENEDESRHRLGIQEAERVMRPGSDLCQHIGPTVADVAADLEQDEEQHKFNDSES